MSKEKQFYTEEELPQRSDEWLKVRETCIGGSDVGTVLSLITKYEKPSTLWKRKTKRLQPKKENDAMRRGASMEKEASEAIKIHLREVEKIENPQIVPYFAKHPEYDFVGISFDGVDLENGFITEIKCPMSSWNFKTVFTDGVQDYYYAQVQLQLFVANAIWGIKKAFFCSYYPDGTYIVDEDQFIERMKTLCVIDVEYDEHFCLEMLKVVKFFWDSIESDQWDAEGYKVLAENFKREVYG